MPSSDFLYSVYTNKPWEVCRYGFYPEIGLSLGVVGVTEPHLSIATAMFKRKKKSLTACVFCFRFISKQGIHTCTG